MDPALVHSSFRPDVTTQQKTLASSAHQPHLLDPTLQSSSLLFATISPYTTILTYHVSKGAGLADALDQGLAFSQHSMTHIVFLSTDCTYQPTP